MDLYNDYIDYSGLLLNNYKELGYSENQVIILLFIITAKKKGDHNYDLKQIMHKMNVSEQILTKEIEELIKTNIIEFKKTKQNKHYITLENLFEKLKHVMSFTEEISLSDEDEEKNYDWINE